MKDDRLQKPRALQQFDRLIGHLNVFLAVVALFLAVLDTTIFVTLLISNEVLDRPSPVRHQRYVPLLPLAFAGLSPAVGDAVAIGAHGRP